MPLLRQLEFTFEQFATRVCVEKGAAVGPALGLPNSWTATGAVALEFQGRNVDLETQARDLLRTAQLESRGNFASNGIHASKPLQVALIIARN